MTTDTRQSRPRVGLDTAALEEIQRQLHAADPLPAAPLADPRWDEAALCAQTDPEAFFPEKGGSTRDAKKVCASCEVKAACLTYALENDERFGIWGGLSSRERRKIRA